MIPNVKASEQAAADDDRVRLPSGDGDLGGGVGHACPSVSAPSRIHAAISAAMVSIGRDEVSAV